MTLRRSRPFTFTALLLLSAPVLAVEGAVSLEVGGGNKTLLLNAMGDISLVRDRLFLVTGYGLVKEANLPREGLEPPVEISATHLFEAGLDWTPSSHWVVSGTFAFSPRASNTLAFPERNLTLVSTQRSLQAFLAVMYQSANFETLDWSLDGSVSAASNALTTSEMGPLRTFTTTTPLLVLRPSLGLTLTSVSRTDISLRGTYYLYSADPTTTGKFDDARFSSATTALSAVLTRVGDFSGYASAPVWLEARGAVLYRFTPRLSGRLAYSYVRYVPGHGYAHVLSTRWSWKLHRLWRLWVSASVQYDDPVDDPALHSSAETQAPFWSGMGSLGGEFTYGDGE